MSEPRPDASSLVTLGQTVETRRRAARRSARDVALAAGISPVYLRVIETADNPKTGRASRPSFDVLMAIARTLDLEPSGLLELAGYPALDVSAPTPHGDTPALDLVPAQFRDNVESIIQALGQARTRPSDFLRAAIENDLGSFAAHLTAAAGGSLRCAPHEDLRLTTRALLTACSETLIALSYDNDALWLTEHGTRFLEFHAERLATTPNLRMHRIFLLTPSRRHEYEAIIAAHQDAGIGVSTIDPLAVPEDCRRDLLVFDRSLLRETVSVSHATAAGRAAEFTDDHPRIVLAEAAFATVADLVHLQPGTGATLP